MDESSKDAFRERSGDARPHHDPNAMMAVTQLVDSDPSSLGLRRLGSSSGGDVEDGAVECPECPSELDRPSVKERTARRKWSQVCPPQPATGSDARDATNCIT